MTLSLDLQYFMSDLDATNYNRNFLFWTSNILQGGAGQAPDPGYVVRNGTLVEANWSGPGTPSTGVYDQISRPDAKATSNYGAFSAELRSQRRFTLSGEIGTSEGHGETPTQDVSETVLPGGTGGGYQLNGIDSAPDFNFGSADTSTPFPGGIPVGFGWIFGAQAVDVEDQEDWAQIDADYALDGGAFTGLQFGLRYSNHERDSLRVIGQGPLAGAMDPANYPDTFQNYPSDFNSIRRIVPEGYLVLDSGAACGLQQFRQRQPRSGGPTRLDGDVPGRGKEFGRLRAGGFRGLQLERQHRCCAS